MFGFSFPADSTDSEWCGRVIFVASPVESQELSSH